MNYVGYSYTVLPMREYATLEKNITYNSTSAIEIIFL